MSTSSILKSASIKRYIPLCAIALLALAPAALAGGFQLSVEAPNASSGTHVKDAAQRAASSRQSLRTSRRELIKEKPFFLSIRVKIMNGRRGISPGRSISAGELLNVILNHEFRIKPRRSFFTVGVGSDRLSPPTIFRRWDIRM